MERAAKMIAKLKKSVFNDWKAKLFSVAMAFMIWFYVQTLQYEHQQLNIPVVYQNLSSNLSINSGSTRYIKMVIRGKKENLKFPTTNLKAVVNLEKARPGTHTYRVYFDRNQLPDSVSVSEIDKDISLSIDHIAKKSVSIEVVLDGKPAQDLRVSSAEPNVQSVTIQGPSSLLKELSSLPTQVVDVTGLKESRSFPVQLKLPDSIELVGNEKIEVKVQVVDQKTIVEKTIEKVKIEVINLDPALQVLLSNTTVNVHVQGSLLEISKLTPESFRAVINAEATTYNPTTKNILPFDNESGVSIKVTPINKSNNIQILNFTPESLNIRFSVKPEFNQPGNNTSGNKETTP